MIRVVLDTNIIVSALLHPLGPPAQVFLLALDGTLQMCVSGSIFAEYEEVIRRPRLRRTEETVLSALEAIRTKAYWVRPLEPVRACSDPDDDVFLECSQASGAAYLVTGNVQDFPLRWVGTEKSLPHATFLRSFSVRRFDCPSGSSLPRDKQWPAIPLTTSPFDRG